MPDFTRWMGWEDENALEGWLDQLNRSGGVAFMMGHQGVSITLVRNGAPLASQTVLLVPASGARSSTPEEKGAAGVGAKDYVFVIGTRAHPVLPDLDIAKGDMFTVGGARYTVTYVDYTMIGKIEARAEAMR
jgi:hypothetical protein